MSTLLRHRHRHLFRRFSTAAASPSAVLTPSNPTAVLTAKQKSRAALSLLKDPSVRSDPERIISICLSASLSPSPSSPIDRSSLYLASSLLSSSPSNLRTLISSLLLSPPPPSPSHVSHAIALFGRAALLDDALSTFKSHSPSTQTLNSLLFASLLAKKPDSAARFFRELPETFHISPNLETYNTLIKSLAESSSSRSFYSVLDEMTKAKISPNATTFCNALFGFYKEGKFDEVPKVLELMKKHNCNPGAMSVYNVRIRSLCGLKRSGDAMEMYKEMVRKGMKPNWVTYEHLIVGFAKEGNLEEAKRVYDLMKKKGRGKVAESGVYFILMHYLCKGGDFEAALGVFRDSMERNWVPGFASMKMLVNGLAKIGKVEEAKDIVGKMKERFPDRAEMWKEVEDGFTQ